MAFSPAQQTDLHQDKPLKVGIISQRWSHVRIESILAVLQTLHSLILETTLVVSFGIEAYRLIRWQILRCKSRKGRSHPAQRKLKASRL